MIEKCEICRKLYENEYNSIRTTKYDGPINNLM